MTTPAEVLEAIHAGPPSLRTAGAAVVFRGEPWRMWWQAPDWVRLEQDVPGGAEVKVQARPHWWLWSPDHGAPTNDGDGSLIVLGPHVYLLDPRPLLASAVVPWPTERMMALIATGTSGHSS